MELPGNRDKKIIDGTHRIVFYLLPLLGLAFLLCVPATIVIADSIVKQFKSTILS